MVKEKICRICNTREPSNFYVDKNTICKICKNEYAKKRYHKKKEIQKMENFITNIMEILKPLSLSKEMYILLIPKFQDIYNKQNEDLENCKFKYNLKIQHLESQIQEIKSLNIQKSKILSEKIKKD
jgi:hypothetical protein